jgi:hypothetical protein
MNNLPAMYWRSDIVAAGGLMSYSVSFTDLDRRAATYVEVRRRKNIMKRKDQIKKK